MRGVKQEVRPLFLPHLVKLMRIIEPGMEELTWISSDWKEFIEKANNAINKFKVLVSRKN